MTSDWSFKIFKKYLDISKVFKFTFKVIIGAFCDHKLVESSYIFEFFRKKMTPRKKQIPRKFQIFNLFIFLNLNFDF